MFIDTWDNPWTGVRSVNLGDPPPGLAPTTAGVEALCWFFSIFYFLFYYFLLFLFEFLRLM